MHTINGQKICRILLKNIYLFIMSNLLTLIYVHVYLVHIDFKIKQFAEHAC